MSKQNAKSMRNAFIRISAYNETKEGIVEYTYDDIKSILLEWSKSKKFLYYLKDHNNEENDINYHFHVVLKFSSPTPFTDVKKRFPYGDIERAGSVKNCVQYLVHMNDLSKTQYDFDEIVTNDKNINKYRLMSEMNKLLKVDEYLRLIDKGIIREYNLTEEIPIEIFATHKTKILNGLEYYRRKIMTDKDRNIDVMIFSGDTGTYKTTYAKQYAKNTKKSICISSSSNDPMQDYKGEDILVLDDIRDTTFKFHDLLKILDNHTKSTVVSRYNNKAFIGDTIIITSSQHLDQWYFNEQKEDKDQLYRRIPIKMQFTKDDISIFEYDEDLKKYLYQGKTPNVNKFKPKKAKKFIIDTVKAMGVEISEDLEKKFDSLDISKYENMEMGQIEQILDEEDRLSMEEQISIYELD